MVVFRRISTLRPRAAVHSRPALLPERCSVPSLVLAEVLGLKAM